MSNILFRSGKHAVNTKAVSVTGDTVKATLVQQVSTAGKFYLVTAASNATPIVLTMSATTGITAGDTLVVGNVGGNTAANGTWTAGTVTGTTVQLLTLLDSNNSTGNGTYTSGGYIVDVTSATTLADISGQSYGTDQTLSGVTDTSGTVNSSAFSWNALASSANKVYGIVIYDNTSNNLLAWYDGFYQVYVVTQAAATATSIAVARLGAVIPNGTVLVFSDGASATLTAQANVGDTSLTVSSLAAIVHRQATADAGPTLNAGMPFLPNGGTQTFQPDATYKLWTI